MDLFFRIFEHLLPRSRVWQIKVASRLRELFSGLTGLPNDARTFIDQRYDDIFPSTTSALPDWENQWGLSPVGLTEAERRTRLDSTWKLEGGQSPKYLQDTLHTRGFTTVFIHEWWEVPAASPPVARNPNLYLSGGEPIYIAEAGEALAEAGEALAEAGNTGGVLGYALVNKIQTVSPFSVGMGNPNLDMGAATAVMGGSNGETLGTVQYALPLDTTLFPYFLYFGGEVFGDTATIPALRREEFENLILSICPGHLWLGVIANYV